ncbi:UNVERIFIED_CONTAM: hypothetical protein GTU68_038223 [Idotea baltica]|nr:hypothetical protein [Idotea baltica]
MITDASIQSLLKTSSKLLENISDSAVLDAELLLAHCINKNRTYLHTWPEKELNSQQLVKFQSLIDKRATDYPVAYLLGKKSFWTLELTVTPDVLIPRPETELLVEIALGKIEDVKNPKILDLGTGSGAIALAIASERKDATIIASDFSEAALEIAKNNAVDLKLNNQVTFIKSDWLENIKEKDFDLILSNPPYIDPEDSHLSSTIRYEPYQALVADNKGMEDIETIISKSHPFLKKGGWLILEHGFDQAKITNQLLTKNKYIEAKRHQDLNNKWRVSIGRKIHLDL